MIFEVIVDISNGNVDKVFDYKGEDYLRIGQRVLVPFGRVDVEGFIVASKEKSELDDSKLKSILFPLDDYVVLTTEMLSLGKKMQKLYNLRMADVLRLFIPAQMRGGKVKEVFDRLAFLCDEQQAREYLLSLRKNAKNQRGIIEYLLEHKSEKTAILSTKYGNALPSLIKQKIINIDYERKVRRPYENMSQGGQHHNLSIDQQQVLDAVSADQTGSFLLFGVTGSGKTEVYMHIIENCLRQNKTAIMLVPEISLTPNMFKQFRARFDDKVAILHSGLSAGQRFDEWQRLRRGEAHIAIGARSAIFAPLENVGAIIIDEQHDASYISETNPRYDTLKVAQLRRKYNDCILLLGSATPSLEAFYGTQTGCYKLLTLPNRINNQPLPAVEIVDMSLEIRSGNKDIFSHLLREELDKCISQNNQAMLYLNRRGYSSFVMCSNCGYVAKCSDCDVSLTFHAQENMLCCHYCGKRFKVLDICPSCKKDSLRKGKMGTEQVVAKLNKLYPDVKILRMDYDTIKTKDSYLKILESFSKGEAQILVGTQMITKGHDFPNVTLVGILEGDQSLYYSDYLATERTFQLITQVSGRSGRDKQLGRVVLQTYTPKHYCLTLAAKQDYLSFYKREINLRKVTNFPPFASVVRILYSGIDSEKCVTLLNAHYASLEEKRLQNEKDYIFMQRTRCPLKKLQKKHRYQILLRLNRDNEEKILDDIYQIVNQKTSKDVSVFVEINPQNLS